MIKHIKYEDDDSEGFFRDDIAGEPWSEYQTRLGLKNRADLAQVRQDQEERFNSPQLVRAGEFIEFSTCKDLQHWPAYVFDVNFYYAELGVHWSATNKEIKEAYQKLNGQSSVRLTFIVKQLLNPVIRAKYDSTPAGSVFFDAYVAKFVKEQMLKDHYEETGRVNTLDDRLAQENEDPLEKLMNKEYNIDNPRVDEIQSRWNWSYYQLRTLSYDIEHLRKWQNALTAIWPKKEKLAVGISERGALAFIQTVGFRKVAFIDAQVTDYDLAAKFLLITQTE